MYAVGVVVVIIIAGLFFWFLKGNALAPSASDTNITGTTTEETTSENDTTGTGVAQTPQGGQRVIENGVAITLVYLTDKGFSPNEVTVNAGESVRFINKTNGAMRIGTVDNLSSTFYSGVNQPNVVGKEGTYDIGLVRQGLWTYSNQNVADSGVTGTVFIR